MGRVKRYTRIKAHDPFSSTRGVVVDPTAAFANAAPVRDTSGDVPRRVAQIAKLAKFAASGAPTPRLPPHCPPSHTS